MASEVDHAKIAGDSLGSIFLPNGTGSEPIPLDVLYVDGDELSLSLRALIESGLVTSKDGLIKVSLRQLFRAHETYDDDVQPEPPERLTFDGEALVVDRAAHEVFVDNDLKVVPRKEFELLVGLATLPGLVQSRDDLLVSVWKYKRSALPYVDDQTVTEHIRKLRVELHDDGKCERFIRTVRGVGYQFVGLPDWMTPETSPQQ